MDNIGILDPEGKNNNPLTDKPYSENYKKLAQIWKNFPVYQRAREIIQDIRNNQVLLLISSTGSGKSVLVPKLALHVFNYEKKIVMTLPKQIIVKSAAEFGAKTLDVEIGDEVGYQYKGSPKEAKSDKTKLLYATDGTIRAILFNDPLLLDFDCVIMDEIHERSTRIDFLLYLLRETLRKRPDFKLIIMSATINPDIFRNYYSEFKFKMMKIEGERLYPITSIYIDENLTYQDVLKKGYDLLIKILETDDPSEKGAHDIIFFITSSNEAFTLCKSLNDHLIQEKESCKITCKGDVYCVEVFSGMDARKQELAQDKNLYKNSKYNRKVVMATNVAESSLTIDGVKFVIDSGYELSSSFDPEYRARRLERQMISQAQAKQRMGRAGRTEPGICYHLYTKNDFEHKMRPFPEPDIRTSDLTNECLSLLNLEQIKNTDHLINIFAHFIEPPKEQFIRVGIDTLMRLGAIEKGTVTKLGALMNDVPGDDPMIAVVIIFAKLYQCSFEVLKILSLIIVSKGNLGDIFTLPTAILQGKKDDKHKLESLNRKLDKAREKMRDKYGDHLSLLEIYETFNKHYDQYENNMSKLNQWCYDNFLKSNTLIKARKQYLKMKDIEEIAKLRPEERALCCLIIGFRLNTAVKKPNTEFYRTQFSKDLNPIKINKLSFLMMKQNLPHDVLYHELFISMGKNELNIVSKIPENIAKLLA
jgi:pre-mRNA-splicing factor ATP-dependent RNA helicase DHX15/PRP43